MSLLLSIHLYFIISNSELVVLGSLSVFISVGVRASEPGLNKGVSVSVSDAVGSKMLAVGSVNTGSILTEVVWLHLGRGGKTMCTFRCRMRNYVVAPYGA